MRQAIKRDQPHRIEFATNLERCARDDEGAVDVVAVARVDVFEIGCVFVLVAVNDDVDAAAA